MTDGTPARPLSLWLADRSRYEAGIGHCQRERYLRFHAGDHGYGWDRKALSMPTLTGALAHEPATTILRQCQRDDHVPDDQWIYTEAILPAVREYDARVAARGLAAVMDGDELARRTLEQVTLLEGLTWAWVRTILPAYLEQYRVVMVEEEHGVVLGCTCGLGDLLGDPVDHDARECRGIAFMTRGDAVAQDRLTGALRYDEFKTTATDTENWRAAWFYRVQLVAGVLGAERVLGQPIEQVYLHVLRKGRHQAEWDREQKKAVGPKYQNSILVYGWRREGNPPLYEEAWEQSYDYVDAEGKNRRLGKDFRRTGIWELPAAYWADTDCLSPADYWTRWLYQSGILSEQVTLIGPIPREPWRLEAFTRQLVGEEQRWKAILWELYEAQQTHDYASPEVQALLDRLVPQNRGAACHSYFGESCPCLPICERHDGWDDPGRTGLYVMRRPHHQPELDQAIGRGLLPPDAAAIDAPEE